MLNRGSIEGMWLLVCALFGLVANVVAQSLYVTGTVRPLAIQPTSVSSTTSSLVYGKPSFTGSFADDNSVKHQPFSLTMVNNNGVYTATYNSTVPFTPISSVRISCLFLSFLSTLTSPFFRDTFLSSSLLM